MGGSDSSGKSDDNIDGFCELDGNIDNSGESDVKSDSSGQFNNESHGYT